MAIQSLIDLTDNQIRVINRSAGSKLGPGQLLNGNSLVPQYMDWSAKTKNILYVQAGPEFAFPIVGPDQYNGLTVGSTAKDPNDVYRQVSIPRNTDGLVAQGGRRIIDLVAPGVRVNTTARGNQWTNRESGTSLAAPHVTGAAALLLQYNNSRLAANAVGWGALASDHNVLKAVLMNSADRSTDMAGDKTILKTDGSTWLTSDARDTADNNAGPANPLDAQMGTGQVNVGRAFQQYAAGQFRPNNRPVPVVGWDSYILNSNSVKKYVFNAPLKQDTYVAITLTWDRTVSLVKGQANSDASKTNTYQPGDNFISRGLNNLDLVLQHKGAADAAVPVYRTTNSNNNVETIYYQIQDEGDYEFWVKPNGNFTTQDYAVAWSAVAATLPAPRVEGAVWQDNGNGIDDPTETGLLGLPVSLIDATGTLVSQTTTDASGNYAFNSVSPGKYHVAFAAPTGYQFTTEGLGTVGTVGSDADANGQTATFTVSAGSDVTLDAGLVPTQLGSIAGTASFDANNDGIRQSSEPVAAGIAVSLFNSNGTQVASTTTDANGNYQFTSVAPGNYSVTFAAPAGFTFSPMNVGSDTTVDSDVDASGTTNLLTLAEGASATHINAGLVQDPTIGGHVWVDANGNGLQDAGELPMSYVEVNLYSAGTFVAATESDAAGNYQFTGIVPGIYTISTVLPNGYAYAPMNQGSNPSLASDIDPSTGSTAPITLSPGQADGTVGIGFVPPPSTGTVSGRAWDDLNGNGIQDAGEPGLANVAVSLTDANAVVHTTQTDSVRFRGQPPVHEPAAERLPPLPVHPRGHGPPRRSVGHRPPPSIVVLPRRNHALGPHELLHRLGRNPTSKSYRMCPMDGRIPMKEVRTESQERTGASPGPAA